jgi:hypothetical protein
MKIKGEILESEKKHEENDDIHWSKKRIAVFISIIGIIIFAIFYFFQLRFGEVLGEKEEKDMSSNVGGPQIQIPSKYDVDEILQDTEENISNIDANDIISSQPQIQNAIEQLEKLTNRDNFKETFCSVICSE